MVDVQTRPAQGPRPAKTRRVESTTSAVAIVALAAVSLLVLAPAPGYDPWMWLLWGREVAHGTLSTVDGPAFKPLPVAVGAVLAPLGGIAPVIWVLLVRCALLAAVWLAFRRAGWVAALAVLLCGGLVGAGAAGTEPALVLALALGAAAVWDEGRIGWALVCGAACALLRVEAWPFLAVAGVVAWRRRPDLRPALLGLAVAIPAAWLVPEWLGSGDVLRSGGRARIPNPGQPALAGVPAVASLRAAAAIPPWPVWVGLAVLIARRDRRALAPAAAGAAWCLLVALMAQAGFSGEPRYALPGAALIALAGAGAARDRAGNVAGMVLAVAVGLAILWAAPQIAGVQRDQAHAWALQRDLGAAIEAAGGRERLLACGTPYTGRLRGPLLAYRLGVRKRDVEPDAPPRAPGVAFRSALHRGGPVEPAAPRWPVATARGQWEVRMACPS